MDSRSRLAYGTIAASTVDLVNDLSAAAVATSLTNGLGDTTSNTIILELFQNAYEK